MGDPHSVPERVILDGMLTIRGIDAVRSRLAATLSEHSAIEVDCSAAVEVDLSLIQLLIAAHRSAEQAGQRLTLAQPADGALRAALIQGGFLPSEGSSDSPEAALWLGPAVPP
jgi:ABC-type transporter Mla MlaB component